MNLATLNRWQKLQRLNHHFTLVTTTLSHHDPLFFFTYPAAFCLITITLAISFEYIPMLI